MSEALETHEHAEHAAEGGRKHTALLIAVLAAGLAFCEQGAQHADTRMTESAVAASDTWGEYQAKSIRANEARDFAAIASVLPAASADALTAAQEHFKQDAVRFENDPQTGKAAIAAHAKALEAERDHAHERLEAFDNAAAALQLGIVLTTASVITGSLMLVFGGAALGLIGGIIAILALIDPGLAAL
jgi:CHASE3 domain sensor protein